MVVEVFSRVLEASWPPPQNDEERIRQSSRGRDFLWITATESAALTASEPRIPGSLARRILRFYVVDDTRGSGLTWGRAAPRALSLELQPVAASTKEWRFEGIATCETQNRRCRATFGGTLVVNEDRIDRFDLTIEAIMHGDGKWSTGAPPGEYKLGIACRIAESPFALRTPPRNLSTQRTEYLTAPCSRLTR